MSKIATRSLIWAARQRSSRAPSTPSLHLVFEPRLTLYRFPSSMWSTEPGDSWNCEVLKYYRVGKNRQVCFQVRGRTRPGTDSSNRSLLLSHGPKLASCHLAFDPNSYGFPALPPRIRIDDVKGGRCGLGVEILSLNIYWLATWA